MLSQLLEFALVPSDERLLAGLSPHELSEPAELSVRSVLLVDERKLAFVEDTEEGIPCHVFENFVVFPEIDSRYPFS